MISIFALIVSLSVLAHSIYSSRRSHRASLQPTLIFYNGEFDPNEVTSWMVGNAGNGPAINVTVAGDAGCRITSNSTVMVLPSIPVGHSIRLGALPHRNVLACTYHDLFGRQYTATCVNNKIIMQKGNLYPNLNGLPRAFLDPKWRKQTVMAQSPQATKSVKESVPL
jgi:hypothetical protein